MAYEPIQIELYQNLKGINEKASEYITGDGYFLNLRNWGFERDGCLVSRPGTQDTASLALATFLVIPSGLVNYEYRALGVAGSMIVFDSGSNLYGLTSTPVLLNASLSSGATVTYPIDFVSAKNRTYVANGQVFGHLGITSLSYYSLMGGSVMAGGVSFIDNLVGATTIFPGGTYVATYAYARLIEGLSAAVALTSPSTDDNFEIGPIYQGPTFNYRFLAATLVAANPSVVVTGITQPDNVGLQGYGISYLAMYLAYPGQTFQYLGVVEPVDTNLLLWKGEMLLRAASTAEATNIGSFTLLPRFLEVYKNMLFMAGFSSAPSTLWHSDVGDVESVQPENFIEVRTDNGDALTCLKVFQNSIVCFKYNSIHEISGDSPETLGLKDVTLEYGCVNNEAAVTFNNKLWFVDKRGVCEYNGPETFIVSGAVDTTFKSLDVSKAKAFHIKKRNEVWFCFGSTTLVYDYIQEAWTIYDNLPIQAGRGSALIDYGASTMDLTYFIQGSSHFPLVRFNDSVFQDRGVNITLISQSPFFKRMGDSTQELFRRLYFDCDVPGVTLAATFNLKVDYSSTTALTKSAYLDRFQKRIEFGKSARSLSIETIIQAGVQVTVNGYALHARYLRSV